MTVTLRTSTRLKISYMRVSDALTVVDAVIPRALCRAETTPSCRHLAASRLSRFGGGARTELRSVRLPESGHSWWRVPDASERRGHTQKTFARNSMYYVKPAPRHFATGLTRNTP